MSSTPNAIMLQELLRSAGATPYTTSTAAAKTKKVARYSLRNLVPVAIEIDRKTPNIWILPEHERGAFERLGKSERYAIGRGKHSNLSQVKEFLERELLKISLTSTDWQRIQAAIFLISNSTTT